MIRMRYETVLLVMLATLFHLGTLGAQPPSNNEGKGQFDINSKTTIYDQNGKKLDFNTFIKLNPGVDYSDLHPNFDSEGELSSISITLIEKKDPSPQRVNQSPNHNNPGTVSSPQSGGNKKFRFTTAKELEGLTVPHYEEKGLNGRTYSSNTMAGKVVVIKFWFLRCGPCLEEIPELNRLQAKYRNNPNVEFLAPATDKLEDVREFVRRNNFNYKILYNSYDIHGDFKVAGYPTHMVIYKSGIVGKVISGKNSQTFRNLEETIEMGLAMSADDRRIERQLGTIRFTPDLVVRAEEGHRLSEAEYLAKMQTGKYSPYRRIKMNGSEEILLVKID